MAKPKDDILYCENCGISFLWSIEEQNYVEHDYVEQAQAQAGDRPKQTAVAPVYCAGCRYLLPAQERERGLVRWYNARKRYGFIMRKNQPDLFAHLSEVKGRKRLQKGSLVEFSVGESNRGPIAQSILILAINPKS